MPRRLTRGLAVVALVVQATLVAGGQAPPALRVVSAAPAGLLDQLADADQTSAPPARASRRCTRRS